MQPRTPIFHLVTLLLALTLVFSQSCKDKTTGSEEKKSDTPQVDKFDEASMKAGETYTLRLQLHHVDRGMNSDGSFYPTLIFNDLDNHSSPIFKAPNSMKDQIQKLEKGKVYKVTFTAIVDPQKKALKGEVSKIEE